MKRILFLLSIFLVLVMLLPENVSAVETEGACGENIVWSFDEASGTLTFSGSGAMSVPSHPQWSALSEKVTKVVIGEGITTIGYAAFSHFKKVEQVVFPASLLYIEGNAFKSCSSLKEINLGNNLKEIGDAAFDSCGIRELTIPYGVTKIGRSAFSWCGSLQSVSIPETVTTIGNNAFQKCGRLTTIVLPDSVTHLGDSAFADCTALADVKLSNNLEMLNNGTFSGCTALTTMHIPDRVSAINDWAFNGCTGLTKLTIGAGLSTIGGLALDNCSNLRTIQISSANNYLCTDQNVVYTKDKSALIHIPRGFAGEYSVLPGTTVIRSRAAYDCMGLTGITIPGSVVSIEKYAFSGCKGLKRVTLGEGVQVLAISAFSGCSSLPEIVFPASIAKIDHSAFYYCTAMSKIYFIGNAPEISDIAFSGVTANAYYDTTKFGWNNAQRLYGGMLTWRPISCEGGHKEEPIAAKEATCTEDGNTEGSWCTICKKTILAPQTIGATGHNFSQWQTIKEPTEKEDGLAQRVCSTCQEVEDMILPKLGQDEPQATQPPTAAATTPPASAPIPSQTSAPTEPPVTEPEVTEPEVTEPEITEPPETDQSAIEHPTLAPEPTETQSPESEQNTAETGEDSPNNPNDPTRALWLVAVFLVLAVAGAVGAQFIKRG